MRLHSDINFPFDWLKGTAMLRYLLNNVGGACNYMAILKLAFFADRYHIRNHARPISMDTYYAFPFGPSGSSLMDIVKMPDFVLGGNTGIKPVGKYLIELDKSDNDLSLFSKSDIKAMNFSLEHFTTFIHKGDFILSEISHAYPEWNQYKKQFESKTTKREPIYYEDFLKNGTPLNPVFIKHHFTDPFNPLSEEEQNEIIDEMVEYSSQLV
jgi:uncharacterized phage-associated protein